MSNIRAKYNATPPTVADTQWTDLQVDANGNLKTSAAAIVPGTGATNLGKAEDAAHASGDTGIMALAVRTDTPAALADTTGDYIPLTTNNLGALYVAPTSATAFATVGAAAHDAAIAGSPNRMAGRALNANYTAVSTGDTADLVTTLVGALVTKDFSIPEGDWTYAAAASGIVNTTTAVTVKAAAAAGLKNYVTGIDLAWDALTNATEFAIRDGAAGTVIWRTKLPSGAAGRYQIVFPTPLRGTAATLLEIVTLSASGAGGVFANLQGYVAP